MRQMIRRPLAHQLAGILNEESKTLLTDNDHFVHASPSPTFTRSTLTPGLLPVVTGLIPVDGVCGERRSRSLTQETHEREGVSGLRERQPVVRQMSSPSSLSCCCWSRTFTHSFTFNAADQCYFFPVSLLASHSDPHTLILTSLTGEQTRSVTGVAAACSGSVHQSWLTKPECK